MDSELDSVVVDSDIEESFDDLHSEEEDEEQLDDDDIVDEGDNIVPESSSEVDSELDSVVVDSDIEEIFDDLHHEEEYDELLGPDIVDEGDNIVSESSSVDSELDSSSSEVDSELDSVVIDSDIEESFDDLHHEEEDEEQLDDELLGPLYDGSKVTVLGAYCAIMEFKRACRLPFTAIAMLLQLLQLLCPSVNKLPRSVYVFKKFFQRYSSPSKRTNFCFECGVSYDLDQKWCANRDCRRHEPNTMISLNPIRAIQRVVSSKWCQFVYVHIHVFFLHRGDTVHFLCVPSQCNQYCYCPNLATYAYVAI